MSARYARVLSVRSVVLALAATAPLATALVVACTPSVTMGLAEVDATAADGGDGGAEEIVPVPEDRDYHALDGGADEADACADPWACSCSLPVMHPTASSTCGDRAWCLQWPSDDADAGESCTVWCLERSDAGGRYCGDDDDDAGACRSLGPDVPPRAECGCDPVAMREYAASTCSGHDFCLPYGADGRCSLRCLDSVGGQARVCP